VVGIGFALYSGALFSYGSIRSREVERSVDHGEMITSSADRELRDRPDFQLLVPQVGSHPPIEVFGRWRPWRARMPV
jgi:hypothetical protein